MSEQQEEQEEMEVPEEEEVQEDTRMKKMVNILLKDLGEVKGLEGKSLEEQFDMLEFLASNKPKAPKRKAPNQPIVGRPTSQDKKQLGTLIYKNGSRIIKRFDPVKLANGHYSKIREGRNS